MTAFTPTRGERNHSPGNLRYVPTIQWDGLADSPQDDAGYCVFRNDVMGIRALAKDLLSKYRRGLTTVRAIIEVYAPPNENDTAAYITDVCARLAVNPDDALTFDNGTLFSFVKAIIWHENGRVLADVATIGQAVSMALAP